MPEHYVRRTQCSSAQGSEPSCAAVCTYSFLPVQTCHPKTNTSNNQEKIHVDHKLGSTTANDLLKFYGECIEITLQPYWQELISNYVHYRNCAGANLLQQQQHVRWQFVGCSMFVGVPAGCLTDVRWEPDDCSMDAHWISSWIFVGCSLGVRCSLGLQPDVGFGRFGGFVGLNGASTHTPRGQRPRRTNIHGLRRGCKEAARRLRGGCEEA